MNTVNKIVKNTGPLVDWLKVNAAVERVRYMQSQDYMSFDRFISECATLKKVEIAALFLGCLEHGRFIDSLIPYNEVSPLAVVVEQIERTNTVNGDRYSTNDAHRILNYIFGSLSPSAKFKRTDWGRYIRYAKTQRAALEHAVDNILEVA